MKPRTEVKYVVRIECLVSEFKILKEINGKIFQNLNHLNKLDVSENIISNISYSGLHRLTYLNIYHNNLKEIPCFQKLYSVIHYAQETQMES
jgi:Leucine-rich repeat (LRR) protein